MKVINYQYGARLQDVAKRHLKGLLKSLTLKKAVNLAEFMYEISTKSLKLHSKPFYIKIEPTNHCNLRCPHCSTLGPRKKGWMDYSLYKEIIDFFSPYCVINCLYGEGEPFLHKDIFKMIEYSEKSKCPVSISSNFNSLNDTDIEKLLDSNLNYLIICIDGATQEIHEIYRRGGNLQKVIHNLHTLSTLRNKYNYKNPTIEIQTIAFDHNKHQLEAITKSVEENGADVHRIRRNLFEIEPTRIKTTCPYLWGSVYIGWDGELAPCEDSILDQGFRYYTFQEIKNGLDYWNDAKMIHARYVVKHGVKYILLKGCACERCYYYHISGASRTQGSFELEND